MRRTSSHSPPPLLPPSPLPSPSPVCFLSPTLPIPFKPVFKRPRSVATPLIHACHRPAPPTARTLSLTAALAASLLLPLAPASAKTLLTENTIFRRYLVTDSAAILRYSLPLPSERQKLPDPAPIRLVQESLEKLGVHLRARGAAGLIAGRRDLVTLRQLLSQRQLDILLDVPARSRKLAAVKLADLERIVSYIQDNLGTSTPIIGDGVLPTPVLRFEQNLQDVFTPRNTIKQVSNYDGAFTNFPYMYSHLVFSPFFAHTQHIASVRIHIQLLISKHFALMLYNVWLILKKFLWMVLDFHSVSHVAITGKLVCQAHPSTCLRHLMP